MSGAFLPRSDRIDASGVGGRLYKGLGTGPHPGVVVLHGAGGGDGYEREYARRLTRHGYTTCCVDYFGVPDAPSALDRISIDRLVAAIEWVSDHPDVAGERVGVVGFSRGGEAALLAGSQSDAVGAVVACSASGYAFPAPTWMDGVETERAAWTVGGEPVPYIPVERHVASEQTSLADSLGDHESNHAVERTDPETRGHATLPVERIDGPVLFVTGGADAIWPADELAGVAIDRLDSHDHPWPYENRVYSDAGHAIRVPYRFDDEAPTADHPLGGTVEANARASADAWLRTLEYLDAGLDR